MGMIRQKIALIGVRFFAFHGLYPEEQLTGTEFIVDIETESDVFTVADDIAQTVDYERLFAIVKAEMNVPRKLIETVAHAILDQVRHEFLSVRYIKVAIRKMHPPMAGEIDHSLVELTFNR